MARKFDEIEILGRTIPVYHDRENDEFFADAGGRRIRSADIQVLRRDVTAAVLAVDELPGIPFIRVRKPGSHYRDTVIDVRRLWLFVLDKGRHAVMAWDLVDPDTKLPINPHAANRLHGAFLATKVGDVRMIEGMQADRPVYVSYNDLVALPYDEEVYDVLVAMVRALQGLVGQFGACVEALDVEILGRIASTVGNVVTDSVEWALDRPGED